MSTAEEAARRDAEVPPSALRVGTRVNEFEITGIVGEGGFGIVYLAFDHSLHRVVALKEYMPASLAERVGGETVAVRSERQRSTFAAGLKSFVNEARLLARFDHPALLKVYRFWEGNGTAYMAMPYYEGRTLKQLLRDEPGFATEAGLRRLLVPVLDALELLHRHQCFHRDVSPDNIMILDSGAPVLLDFGAARRIIGDLTQGVTVILKPGYAPVEQYADDQELRQGPWTDIYAVGAVLYAAIVGKPPPSSVARMVKDPLEPLADRALAGYHREFLAAIDLALAVRPEQRPQSIAAFREALGLLPVAAAAASSSPTGAAGAPDAGGDALAARVRPPPVTAAPGRTERDDATRIAPRHPPTEAGQPQPPGARAQPAEPATGRRWWPLGGALLAAVVIAAIVVAMRSGEPDPGTKATNDAGVQAPAPAQPATVVADSAGGRPERAAEANARGDERPAKAPSAATGAPAADATSGPVSPSSVATGAAQRESRGATAPATAASAPPPASASSSPESAASASAPASSASASAPVATASPAQSGADRRQARVETTPTDAALPGPPESPSEPGEAAKAWATVQGSCLEQVFIAFVFRFPDSPHVAEARRRLVDLQAGKPCAWASGAPDLGVATSAERNARTPASARASGDTKAATPSAKAPSTETKPPAASARATPTETKSATPAAEARPADTKAATLSAKAKPADTKAATLSAKAKPTETKAPLTAATKPQTTATSPAGPAAPTPDQRPSPATAPAGAVATPAAKEAAPTASTVARATLTGSVSLQIRPWGEVYVDGVLRGVSPPLKNFDLPEGRHVVEFRNPGFPTNRREIEVRRSERVSLAHEFR